MFKVDFYVLLQMAKLDTVSRNYEEAEFFSV